MNIMTSSALSALIMIAYVVLAWYAGLALWRAFKTETQPPVSFLCAALSIGCLLVIMFYLGEIARSLRVLVVAP